MKKTIFALIVIMLAAVAASAQTTIDTTKYENGTVKLITPMKDGKYHGTQKFFNQDGSLRYEYTYNNGIPDGISIFYYDSGARYSHTVHKDGVFVENFIYNEDGSLAYVSKLEKGKCVERDSKDSVIYSAPLNIDKYCR